MMNVAASLLIASSSLSSRPLGRAAPSRACVLAADTMEPSYTLISTSLLAKLMGVDQRHCSTPPLPKPLKNRYFALRHGQSTANVEGVISSDPAVGTVRHGLTVEGRLQARRAATQLIDAVGREHVDKLHFYASDFTRAYETAEEALAAVINVIQFEASLSLPDRIELTEPPPCLETVTRTERLRERCFGELDALPLHNYNKVWPRDLVSAEHEHYGVESVASVAARVRELILELEALHDGCTIVLTSHADTLQITQCYVAGADPRTFSQYRFKNGEVRELRQDPTSMPEPVPLTYQ